MHVPPPAIRAIVLDIEGTTTPMRFVYDVLFPFARRHLRDYLRDHWNDDAVQESVARLRAEWQQDLTAGAAPPPWPDEGDDLARLAEERSDDRRERKSEGVAAYAEWLMDRDRKSPGLKRLQGLIWEGGYRSGALAGELFPDVRPAIERWHTRGIQVAVYSSGSVLAQRLLFAHTPQGDLTPLFARFFDTDVGPKSSPDSYRRIASLLGCAPGRLLFVSDSVQELAAAREAGCDVRLCARPGNPAPPESAAFELIYGLDEIAIG